jgi:hypothetical protein
MIKNSYKYNKAWQIVYATYPLFLRLLEKLGAHNTRQDYHLGFLKENTDINQVKKRLKSFGFEHAILAWRDRNEVLSMRLVHEQVYQYHIRIYSDGEVRSHYEYSSEGAPIAHILEKKFTPEPEFFKQIMKVVLK